MPDTRALFDEIKTLATEQRNPASRSIDTASIREILDIINTEDHLVPIAVRREIPYIEQAVEHIVRAFQNGGRLFYVGAGTSGRIGVVDASECPPTYGSPPEMVQGLMAGGQAAMFKAQEGAEDSRENGARDLDAHGVTANDIVCGIAASRRTPYVLGALQHAREVIGATTLFITCVPRETLTEPVDVAICPVVGPEVVMGSTRMKSGTAQKLVVNMLTTAAFIRMGKVYENMMIDLMMTNAKLVERSKRIVMTATGVDYDTAAATLAEADGHVKTALVMLLGGASKAEATERLSAARGFVRYAIAGEAYPEG
ncbi:MAG: N-acetylmuramic acid 6-phosphate etherase [Bacteroidetes bacterium]|nr:N-acetylmuramic acid 6-phosphate etherase [Bacteroidota bacterium]